VIRVTIELIPFGNEEEKSTLGEINIINDLTSSKRPEFGNYIIKYKSLGYSYQKRLINIKNHKREDGYLKLLQKVVNKLVKI
jgi:hypothetical protein